MFRGGLNYDCRAETFRFSDRIDHIPDLVRGTTAEGGQSERHTEVQQHPHGTDSLCVNSEEPGFTNGCADTEQGVGHVRGQNSIRCLRQNIEGGKSDTYQHPRHRRDGSDPL